MSGTVTDLQAKMDSIEKTNCKLVEEVGCALELTPLKRFHLKVNWRRFIDFLKKILIFICPQLTAATDRINSLQEEQEQLRKENETILHSSQKKEEVSSTLSKYQTVLLKQKTTRTTNRLDVFVFPGSSSGQSGGAGDVQADSTRSG